MNFFTASVDTDNKLHSGEELVVSVWAYTRMQAAQLMVKCNLATATSDVLYLLKPHDKVGAMTRPRTPTLFICKKSEIGQNPPVPATILWPNYSR